MRRSCTPGPLCLSARGAGTPAPRSRSSPARSRGLGVKLCAEDLRLQRLDALLHPLQADDDLLDRERVQVVVLELPALDALIGDLRVLPHVPSFVRRTGRVRPYQRRQAVVLTKARILRLALWCREQA